VSVFLLVGEDADDVEGTFEAAQWRLEGYGAETPGVRHRYVLAVSPLWYVNGVVRWLRAECSKRSRAIVMSADAFVSSLSPEDMISRIGPDTNAVTMLERKLPEQSAANMSRSLHWTAR